jgi:hypothetical protein
VRFREVQLDLRPARSDRDQSLAQSYQGKITRSGRIPVARGQRPLREVAQILALLLRLRRLRRPGPATARLRGRRPGTKRRRLARAILGRPVLARAVQGRAQQFAGYRVGQCELAQDRYLGRKLAPGRRIVAVLLSPAGQAAVHASQVTQQPRILGRRAWASRCSITKSAWYS